MVYITQNILVSQRQLSNTNDNAWEWKSFNFFRTRKDCSYPGQTCLCGRRADTDRGCEGLHDHEQRCSTLCMKDSWNSIARHFGMASMHLLLLPRVLTVGQGRFDLLPVDVPATRLSAPRRPCCCPFRLQDEKPISGHTTGVSTS